MLMLGACGRTDANGLPDGDLVIRVRGEDYQWHVRYPGPDGVLDTADDVLGLRDLHVPARKTVRIDLESADYIYGFRIPELGVNQMAVPELDFAAQLFAEEAGSHPLMGDQMCGFAHESLLGQVVVHAPADFVAWQRQPSRP